LNNKSHLQIPLEINSENIKSILSGKYKFEKFSESFTNETIFDTFDWRLLKNSISLVQTGNIHNFISLENNEILYQYISKSKRGLQFLWEFPDAEFITTFKKIIDIRALIFQFTLNKQIESFKLLNNDEKIVAYLQFNKVTLTQNEIKKKVYFMIINEVRGYYSDKEKVSELLKEIILESYNSKQLFLQFLYELNIFPEQLSSKYNLHLKPAYKTHEAVSYILKYLLQTIKKNEDGLIKDIDTEFLHDFRVAARRSRTLLSQVKNVFADREIENFKTQLKSITKQTNRLRDLDVYLLNQNYYYSLIPDYLRRNLNLMFSDLKKERKREHKKVADWLKNVEYKKFLVEWNEFLNCLSVKKEFGLNGKLPVKQVAIKNISKKYKSILKLGNSITDATPDEQIHILRIECKKLRYLLEFFSSLFNAEKVQIFIKQLKKLQDNLGKFNDLHMQQIDVQNYINKKTGLKSYSTEVFVTLGALINALHIEQKRERKAFLNIFSEFANKKNRKLFKNLFISEFASNQSTI